RQRTQVRAGIRNCFMLLIKGLRDLQCAFRREPEAIVRFALQGREIIKLRRDLRRRFFLFQLYDPLLATAFALNGVRDFAMPQSRRIAVLVPERTVDSVKSLLNRSKPSRIASGVIDCSQRRLIGFFVPAYWMI